MPSSSDPMVTGAFLEGWRRVIRAPVLVVSVLAVTFLSAVPIAIAARTDGLAQTSPHEIFGFGATIAIVSDFIDHEPLEPGLAAAIAAYIALWVFLSGGILDRLARGRAVRTSAFFSACGVYFVRFLRLAVIVGAAYWALFRWLHPYLFDVPGGEAIWLRAVRYAVFAGALGVVSIVADFAKVRAVVEDRHSMLSALMSSIRFIRRRFFRVSGLYLLNVIALLIILRLWLAFAPAPDAAPWFALLVAQVYLVARVWAKLAFVASETVFFQGALAHAHYTAAPEPVWPDSPAAEAIDNLVRSSRP